jgi:hypothetical protein
MLANGESGEEEIDSIYKSGFDEKGWNISDPDFI